MEETKSDAVLSEKVLTFRRDIRMKCPSNCAPAVSQGELVGVIQMIDRKVNYQLSSIGDQMVQIIIALCVALNKRLIKLLEY